jgi:hypothetical protein
MFAASIMKPALEAAGMRVFMDFSNLTPGCEWPAALVDAAAHSAVVVAVLSQSYVRRFWCMYELDLALHGAHGTPRSGDPLVIPVFYDDPSVILQPAAGEAAVDLQKLWQARLAPGSKAVPADRQQLVNPKRWAENFATIRQQLQNLRLSSIARDKDNDYQLARKVLAAALPFARNDLAVPPGLVGYEQQEAHLLSELAVSDPEQPRLGLWLHGMGKGMTACTAATGIFSLNARHPVSRP